MRTNVYIDGFNFYYGAVKGTPYKWVDLARLCTLLLPKNQINQVKYFTAPVSARPGDPDQPNRQQMYFRALRTCPNLSIIEGRFLTSTVRMRPARPIRGMPRHVEVEKTEEKGSDVNLATHLLCDGFRDEYDVAVVVTNDSDLLAPIRFVRHELKKVVGVLNPHRRASNVLAREADFIKPIRAWALQASQFPLTLADGSGTIAKPPSW